MKLKKKMSRKAIILCALLCFVIVCSTVAGTVAYLWDTSGVDSTTMTKATISADIVGSSFADLQVQNTGNVKVYVRVLPIINFTYLGQDGAGAAGIFYCAEPPSTSTVTYRNGSTRTADYSFDYNSTDWLKGGDGYYYLKAPLGTNNAKSAKLVKTFTVSRPRFTYGGHYYYLTAEAACEVIQCESMAVDTPAVEKAWGVTLEGDSGSNIKSVPSKDFNPYA